jgi:hypothetical protein
MEMQFLGQGGAVEMPIRGAFPESENENKLWNYSVK